MISQPKILGLVSRGCAEFLWYFALFQQNNNTTENMIIQQWKNIKNITESNALNSLRLNDAYMRWLPIPSQLVQIMACRLVGTKLLSEPQAPLTPSNWSALYRGRGSPVMSCIFLKANNAQQSSGGCAGFNVRLKSYRVLIFNFNSTNE